MWPLYKNNQLCHDTLQQCHSFNPWRFHKVSLYLDIQWHFSKGVIFYSSFLFHGTYLKYHCLISSLIIRTTSYVMTLYRSVIVVIFHGVTLNNIYIYICSEYILIKSFSLSTYECPPNIPSTISELKKPRNPIVLTKSTTKMP